MNRVLLMLLPILLAVSADTVAQFRDEPLDWDPIPAHAAYLLRQADDDFAALRGEQINDRMWLSRHVIGSPFGQDDPIPPSVVVAGSDGTYFHGTRLSIGTELQMRSAFYSDVNAIGHAFAPDMLRTVDGDAYMRLEGCLDSRRKYIMLTNLPGEDGRHEVMMTVGRTGEAC